MSLMVIYHPILQSIRKIINQLYCILEKDHSLKEIFLTTKPHHNNFQKQTFLTTKLNMTFVNYKFKIWQHNSEQKHQTPWMLHMPNNVTYFIQCINCLHGKYVDETKEMTSDKWKNYLRKKKKPNKEGLCCPCPPWLHSPQERLGGKMRNFH